MTNPGITGRPDYSPISFLEELHRLCRIGTNESRAALAGRLAEIPERMALWRSAVEPKQNAMAESIAAQIEAGHPGPDWGER